MDPSGFEPETSALQGQRSPTELRAQYGKKEVIHLQVPLQVPCDDLTRLTKLGFGLTIS